MGTISVWYDEEGDYLELTREADETIGFAVLNVSARKQRELPFDVTFENQSSDA